MRAYKIILALAILIVLSGCDKKNFLDKKPNSTLVVPKGLNDFQGLLDNTDMLSLTGGLAQLSADEYTVDFALYRSSTAILRNAYVWERDIYSGEQEIRDWNVLYKGIFYANAVLDGLSKSAESSSPQGQYLKGWALFSRAYAFYDLTRNFCKVYDAGSANNDYGIPLRLEAGIDYTKQRSTLQQTFDQILRDLAIAENLLPPVRPTATLNRPSRIAVYALLARIYLDMRNYDQAENYSEKCLNLYNTLINYNTLNQSSAVPFPITNEELIYHSNQVVAYSPFTNAFSTVTGVQVSPELISLYSVNDLRSVIFFNKLANNIYTKKRGYSSVSGAYPFTGLATDEVYLILAECLARRDQISQAMDLLNQLLIKRWNPAATTPLKPYQNITASTPKEALEKILLERRKELVWRGLRWHDLKRLNKEGADIKLSRNLNGTIYTLAPNDPRYIFPIPDDEITLSGIKQNDR